MLYGRVYSISLPEQKPPSLPPSLYPTSTFCHPCIFTSTSPLLSWSRSRVTTKPNQTKTHQPNPTQAYQAQACQAQPSPTKPKQTRTKSHHTTLSWIASLPLISRLPLRCVVSCATPSPFPSCAGGDGSRDHVLSRLEHVWGPGDGRPVEDLKVAIDQVSCQFSKPQKRLLGLSPC